MNVVKEINKINELELQLGASGASWHDEYKDSAYVFVGGLHTELTEGDVIVIFSQYGEVMDVNMPRDKATGKQKGFAFLMYEDQRSTVLAVDNLNGATVLDRTLRVDHVKNYKQPKTKGEDGEWIEPEDQSMNAKPEMIVEEDTGSESDVSREPSIDPEDPMRDYLIAERKEKRALKKAEKAKTKTKTKHKHKHAKDETPEERDMRKQRKREKKMKKDVSKSEGVKGVEALLSSLERRIGRPAGSRSRSRSHSRTPERRRKRTRSPSVDRYRDGQRSRSRHSSIDRERRTRR